MVLVVLLLLVVVAPVVEVVEQPVVLEVQERQETQVVGLLIHIHMVVADLLTHSPVLSLLVLVVQQPATPAPAVMVP